MADALARRSETEAVRTIVHRGDREPLLLQELAAAKVGWQAHVVVDLGDTAMVSAAVLSALRGLGASLRERGGELTVRSSHPGLVRLLELTLLTLSFSLERSEPEPACRAS